MLNYVSGNLFTSPAQTLVNTVNTEGVMGKGIALTFKRLFPEMYEEYKKVCEADRLSIGKLHVYAAPPKIIVNFPTKTTWRKPSTPAYIEAGLATFQRNFARVGVRSVAFPPLGCGNGELDFEKDVQPLMEKYLADLPIPVYVYPPLGRVFIPEHQEIDAMKQWLAKEASVPTADAVWEDLRMLLLHHKTFKMFTTQAPFHAMLSHRSGIEEIVVQVRDRQYGFERAEVEGVWGEFRKHLLLTPRAFIGNERAASYLLPILAGLDYVEPIRISRSPDQLRQKSTHGVQFAPPRRTPQSQRTLPL